MLVRLSKNLVSTNNGQVITKAIAAVLTGTATTGANLDSTQWYQSDSTWSVGSYAMPSYWYVENDNSGSTTSGSITLSIASNLSGKRNYLQISYSNTASITFYIGSGFSGGALVNPVEVKSSATSGICLVNSATPLVGMPLYIRFATGFVHIWSPFYAGASTSWFVGMEMSNNLYDTYSLEGTFKGWTSYTFYVSNFYRPKTDLYPAGVTPPVGGLNGWSWFNKTPGLSRNANPFNATNPTDAINLLVPITVSLLADGWLGDNISNLTGIYNGTSYNVDERVTIGGNTYIDTGTYIAKI